MTDAPPGHGPALTYAEEGATRRSPLPPGYHHIHEATWIGHGRSVFETAGEAVTAFRMHRAAGLRVSPAGARAVPGAVVECALGIGPFRVTAPCRVVWSVHEDDRIGFAYGTLPGHPECGEESFVVTLRADGSVWVTVTAFSRPGLWYTRLAGPVGPAFQRGYARYYGKSLRRLVGG
ncbi:DUF1990 domain-containing protein [Streptomyces sp. NPDC003077]|uniref:DUF1990 family protein n=1 Tax=Streptomyces sp. NPDC003077 TaxID=3154443 RepID=UPI00339DB65E